MRIFITQRLFILSTAPQILYVGSYAAANQAGIYGYTFDDGSGELTVRGTFVGIASPSFVVVHPNGQWQYAVSEMEGGLGAVWSFRCTHEPWSMEPINHQMSGGDAPCHLAIDATGRWLLVSNYSSGTLSVLPILANGALGKMTDLIVHHGSGPHPERQQGPHVHSTVFTPDQHFVIVADLRALRNLNTTGKSEEKRVFK